MRKPTCSAHNCSLTQLACQRARSLPRVPIRSVSPVCSTSAPRSTSRAIGSAPPLGPRDHDRDDPRGARALQGAGGGPAGRAGGQDVVDEEDRFALQGSRLRRPGPEGAPEHFRPLYPPPPPPPPPPRPTGRAPARARRPARAHPPRPAAEADRPRPPPGVSPAARAPPGKDRRAPPPAPRRAPPPQQSRNRQRRPRQRR